MALIGYARVSTEDQATRRQLDELCAAGCQEILEEHASGADRDRPVLAQTLARLRPGDTLVVVALDRLARSLSHLLEVIEGLQARDLGTCPISSNLGETGRGISEEAEADKIRH